jgi:hypothetical protein
MKLIQIFKRSEQSKEARRLRCELKREFRREARQLAHNAQVLAELERSESPLPRELLVEVQDAVNRLAQRAAELARLAERSSAGSAEFVARRLAELASRQGDNLRVRDRMMDLCFLFTAVDRLCAA